MDTALLQKFSFILDRNLAKANCTENHVCTSCDTVVLVHYIIFFIRIIHRPQITILLAIGVILKSPILLPLPRCVYPTPVFRRFPLINLSTNPPHNDRVYPTEPQLRLLWLLCSTPILLLTLSLYLLADNIKRRSQIGTLRYALKLPPVACHMPPWHQRHGNNYATVGRI